MWSMTIRGLIVGCVCLTSVTYAEQLAPVRRSIGFDQAIELTLARNPSLVSAGYHVEIASSQVTQAKLRPNTELQITTENIAGSGRFSSVDSAETTFSLGWVLERGKRTKRIETAQAGVSLAEAERDIKRLDVAAETARLYLDCVSLKATLQQAVEGIALAKTSVSSVGERVNAGRSPDADLARAEVELARAELVSEDLGHELLVAMYRLAAQWGDVNPLFNEVVGSLEEVPKVSSLDDLKKRLQDSADQRWYLNEQRLRESEIRLAQNDAKPNWRLSTGVRRFESTDDHAFVAELSIPLSLRNKNQGRIAGSRAALSLSAARQSEALLRSETKLFAMYQELQHSLHVANAFKKTILPKVEQALLETQRAYETGRYSFYELSSARAELLSARISLVEANVGALKRIIEIERLTGMSLSSSFNPAGGDS